MAVLCFHFFFFWSCICIIQINTYDYHAMLLFSVHSTVLAILDGYCFVYFFEMTKMLNHLVTMYHHPICCRHCNAMYLMNRYVLMWLMILLHWLHVDHQRCLYLMLSMIWMNIESHLYLTVYGLAVQWMVKHGFQIANNVNWKKRSKFWYESWLYFSKWCKMWMYILVKKKKNF